MELDTAKAALELITQYINEKNAIELREGYTGVRDESELDVIAASFGELFPLSSDHSG